ncbi:MAG: VWA domain-containing protein [Polyangiaceae bacterium]|nr:VWA domain-containing protein [Polyangiaceae bacterium]
MARRCAALVACTLFGLFVPVSCAEEDDNGIDDPDGTGGGANIPQFRDVDGDGVPDPLQAEEFGGGAVAVTDADIDAARTGACTGWSAEPEPMGSSLFLVVDASSSMDAEAANTNGRPKWDATRDALIDAVQNLPGTTAVGLLGYPNRVVSGNPGGSEECVNVAAAITPEILDVNGHRQRVVDGLNAIQTETCTPTHDAYNVAVEAYRNANVVGQKYILLMTDGTPTLTLGCEPGQCAAGSGYEQPVIDAITSANQDLDIKTFVLGSPGSEQHMDTGLDNRWWLSEAAEFGGTSLGNGCTHDRVPYCHFDLVEVADFSTALEQTLETIAGRVISCDYGLGTPPAGQEVSSDAINLFIWPGGTDPIQILRSQDPDCTQGWYFDAATERVRLCSESCSLVQSDPELRLELMFGCASAPIIR